MKAVKLISRLEGHTDEVNCVDMRNKLLISGGSDSNVRLWNWEKGECVAVFAGHSGKVRMISHGCI